MHPDLVTRRRSLMVTYERYLAADRAWATAVRHMQLWFPAASRSRHSPIGNPGSPIRRLYEKRERALLQLETAHLKLDVARERLAARKKKMQDPYVMLVTHAGD